MSLAILSTMALHGMMQAFTPSFEADSGIRCEAEFLPTLQLLERIRAGDRADLAILTAEGIDALVAEGILAGRVDLARSFIGVAVKAGSPHPDIGTVDAFVAALRQAGSVAMSKAGASGVYMAGLLERLGIADEIRAKATILSSGYTASLAADGTVALAIQQVSELKMVDGIEIVGRLPPDLGGDSIFSAGVFVGAPHADQARQLVAALSHPGRAALYEQCGLERVASA